MPAVSSRIIQMGPFNRSIEKLCAVGRVEKWGQRMEGADGKREREEWKEETSRESETVRLAIINHICCCWRRPRILATRQTLQLPLHPLSIFLYQLGHSPPPLPTGCAGPCLRHPAQFALFVLTLWKSDIMAANKTQNEAEHTGSGPSAASQIDLQISSCAKIKPDYGRSPLYYRSFFWFLQCGIFFNVHFHFLLRLRLNASALRNAWWRKTQFAGESHGGLNHHFSKIGRRSLTGSRARRVKKKISVWLALLPVLSISLINYFFFERERAAVAAGQTSLTRRPPLPWPSLILLHQMWMQGQFVKSFPVWAMSGKHRQLSEQEFGKR